VARLNGQALNAVVLAMIRHRQGDPVAAAQSLKHARQLSASTNETPPQDWLEFHVLLREAEAMLGAKP